MESGAKENKTRLVHSYDSPSHKLLKKGSDSLSDAELLSLFMNENVELAKRALLFNLQSLRELFRARPDEFEVLGISQDTYIQGFCVKRLQKYQ